MEKIPELETRGYIETNKDIVITIPEFSDEMIVIQNDSDQNIVLTLEPKAKLILRKRVTEK